jgi:hypothetical protein
MAMLHNTIGGLLALAFILLVIVSLLRVTGREIGFARPLSMIAAGLLIVQYILGFLLMGGGARNSNLHYLIALLAIIPVAMDHGWAANRATAHQRAMGSLIASALATVLILYAYMLGMNNVVPAETAAFVVSLF